ncbi:Transcription factor VOZ1 [Camellia lanceoleosa]|uniref:Transcription factor VOZ1 n=1 Tax=Camellia lanceoleosa TaxID=1840588 RepID=A0ACC0IQZ9_9ERIC|nr:Transcription factor VOZ1 [Camellia lanceoleosa]
MGKGSKTGGCKSASHSIFKDRAKNRVDDLQGMFTDLQSARKESRSIDVAMLEEQVHQMLREWKAELNEPSPASSLQGGSLGSFSADIQRLMQLCEEQDDATSGIATPKELMNLILDKGHSRVAVYNEQPTNIIGLVLVKNLLTIHPEDEVPVKSVTIRRIPSKTSAGNLWIKSYVALIWIRNATYMNSGKMGELFSKAEEARN